MADDKKHAAPGSDGGRYPDSPAKVPGDRDEAKALPDDIAVNERGGPNADTHYPAAATPTADEEAGASGSEGRIEPLQRRGPSKPAAKPAGG